MIRPIAHSSSLLFKTSRFTSSLSQRNLTFLKQLHSKSLTTNVNRILSSSPETAASANRMSAIAGTINTAAYSTSAGYESNNGYTNKSDVKSTFLYASSVVIIFIGLSFAAVPLYQLFCSTTGVDGTPKTGAGTKWTLKDIFVPDHARQLKITFDSSVSELMPWKFHPETRQISVKPGSNHFAISS